jgi:thiol-disulfide isomerase/thioredoxin
MNGKVNLALGLIVFFLAGVAAYYLTEQQARDDSAPDVPVPTASAPSTDTQEAPPGVTNLGEFELPDLSGTLRHSSEWDGKARMVNFWATWCAPCRREIPLLKKTQEEHGAENVQVIGIAVDFPEEVTAYAEEVQFNYPVLIGQEEAMAVAETSGVDFIGMPFTMIVAPGGELIKAHIGEIVESHIEEILHVFAALEAGSMDIDGAREALSSL